MPLERDQELIGGLLEPLRSIAREVAIETAEGLARELFAELARRRAAEDVEQVMTVNQIVERTRHPIADGETETALASSTIYSWISEAEDNGLLASGALMKVGGRVYLHQAKFFGWLQSRSELKR